MMGPVGQDTAMRGAPDRTDGPGKKMAAVGQQAKNAVTAAREAGVELPKNAQGVAASGLARGADPASLFAALVQPAPTEPPVIEPDQPVMSEATEKALAVPVQDLLPDNIAGQ